MKVGTQTKRVSVERGMFLIRYAEAADELRPPKVTIAVNPGDENSVELFLSPDHDQPVLWQPGSCLVGCASAAAQLTVEVSAFEPGGSVAATVQVEALSQGIVRGSAHPVGASLTSGQLRILAHVAGRGDVVVGEREWIAGPDAPTRIEGLAIEWLDKPDDVGLRYAARLARPAAGSGQPMRLGEFAGTRGRALPITGLSLELSGAGAARLSLTAEATFLGAPVMRMSGRMLDLSGPTGREPLVGLRLALQGTTASHRPQRQQIEDPRTSRVRVFRPAVARRSGLDPARESALV